MNHFLFCSRDMKAKGIKFLILLSLWILAIYVAFAIVYFDDTSSAIDQVKKQGTFLSKIFNTSVGFFEHADSWNYLSLLLFISGFLFLFSFTDLVLEKYFKSRSKTKSFVRGGVLWLSHKLITLGLVFIQFLLITNLLIMIYGWMKTVDIEDIEKPMAVLVLGTNKNLSNKPGRNVYFTQRMDAAAELYHQGKTKKIYVSGDNGRDDYNEPLDMKRALIERGVPESVIELDYAGFRTLDSVMRLNYHFGEREALIVSQQFQLQRALVLARYYEIDPLGYPSEGSMTFAMLLRETLAKPRVIMDIFLFNTQPRFGKAKKRSQIELTEYKTLILVLSSSFLFLISLGLTYRTLDY